MTPPPYEEDITMDTTVHVHSTLRDTHPIH